MRTIAPVVSRVRTMPEFKARRESQPRILSGFATQLAGRMREPNDAVRRPDRAARASEPGALDPAGLAAADFGPPPSPERAELLRRAQGLLGIPYVWGGDSPTGLDCSSFISRIWGVPRQTTDTLPKITDPITRDELRAGDVMNLPTWKDPEGFGHVRMFDRWADARKTKMWVYEETTADGLAKSVHRVIDYDPSYQPMRWRELAG